MVYQQEADSGDINPDAYDHDAPDGEIPKGEQARVVHLVHAWIQQNQPKKVIHSLFFFPHHITQCILLGTFYIL